MKKIEYELKRISYKSASKIFFFSGFIIGCILGVIDSILTLIESELEVDIFLLELIIADIFSYPLITGLLFLISGIITIGIYNYISDKVGGMNLTLIKKSKK